MAWWKVSWPLVLAFPAELLACHSPMRHANSYRISLSHSAPASAECLPISARKVQPEHASWFFRVCWLLSIVLGIVECRRAYLPAGQDPIQPDSLAWRSGSQAVAVRAPPLAHAASSAEHAQLLIHILSVNSHNAVCRVHRLQLQERLESAHVAGLADSYRGSAPHQHVVPDSNLCWRAAGCGLLQQVIAKQRLAPTALVLK